jgi:hypothetical protein
MPIPPFGWHDGPTGGTPLSSANLEAMLQGVGSYTDAAKAASAQGLVPTAVKTSAYALAAADFVPVDASAGGVALSLPNAPPDKTRVGVKIIAQAGSPNTLTITCGGADVFNKAGGSTTLSLLALFQAVVLQYAAGPKIWYTQSTDSPLGQAGGAASLDTTGHLPSGQLPASAVTDSSSVDLCRGPYNCQLGADITTIVQNAVSDLVVPGSVTDFYFSQPGTYLLNGPQQSGTVSGRAYSGQIVLPGLADHNGGVVRFRGLSAPAFGSNHVGVTLLSNATSGNVFSVAPAGTGGEPTYSSCMPRFEDLNIVCPSNPQCGALDLSNSFRAQVERIWLDGQGGDPTALTGAGIALALPRGSNGGFSIARDFYISSFPSGLSVGDHAQIQGDAYVSYCVNALRGSNACAANLQRLMALHCLNGIVPDGTLFLEGAFNWSEF